MVSMHRQSYQDVTKLFEAQDKRVDSKQLFSVVEGYLAGEVWKESQNLRDLSQRLRRFSKSNREKLQTLIAKVDVALELCRLKQQHNLEDSALQTINNGLSNITSFSKGKVKLENECKLAVLQRQLGHSMAKPAASLQDPQPHSINSSESDFSLNEDEDKGSFIKNFAAKLSEETDDDDVDDDLFTDDKVLSTYSLEGLLPHYFKPPYSDGGKALPSLAKLRRAYNDACLDLLKKDYGTDLVRKAMIQTLPLADRKSLGAGKTVLNNQIFASLNQELQTLANQLQEQLQFFAPTVDESQSHQNETNKETKLVSFTPSGMNKEDFTKAQQAPLMVKEHAVRASKSLSVVPEGNEYNAVWSRIASFHKMFKANYDRIIEPNKHFSFRDQSFLLLDPSPTEEELLAKLKDLGGPDLVHKFLTQKLTLKERNALVNQLNDLNSSIN